jgi:predicted ribosome quality control (RQC) complex YloA/Tae2 family protein
MSPLAAAEAVFRTTGDAAAPAGHVEAAGLLTSAQALFEEVLQGQATPSVALEDNTVVAYAPYRLSHRERAGAVVDVPTISEAIERFETDSVGRDQYRVARAGVEREIARERELVQRRIAALEREKVDEQELERLRLGGDLILTLQRQIEPGQTALSGTLDPAFGPMTVELDPALTPVENAQAHYERYRRKKRAAEALPARLAKEQALVAVLDQLETDLLLATNRAEIDAVHDALLEIGSDVIDSAKGGQDGSRRKGRRSAPGAVAGKPLRLLSSDGLVLLVGRNRGQNETVTFKLASRNDLWLHARDVPGGHVVVKSAGRSVPERTLREAAGLALHFSRVRESRQAEVIVTEVRHVRRLKGAGKGMVRYERERTLVATPLDPSELEG